MVDLGAESAKTFREVVSSTSRGPRGLLFLTYCDYKIVFSLLPSEEASKREENGLLGLVD